MDVVLAWSGHMMRIETETGESISYTVTIVIRWAKPVARSVE